MYNYLALGDSYTIGESVPSADNFPNQIVSKLKEQYELAIAEPKIIATTGWTTEELLATIKKEEDINPLGEYTFSTLLIGVNNQYRGQEIQKFLEEFEILLQKTIAHTKGGAEHTFVLSIPDWGITPFAKERDTKKIAIEIAAYNQHKKAIVEKYNCHFIDITPSTIAHGNTEIYLVEDLLHYSGKEYEIWAQKVVNEMAKVFHF